MISYKNKYKKYKQKYLNLKKEMTNEITDYNTKKFIKQKYIFNLDEHIECKYSNNYGKEFQSNPKYEKFDQIFYHAGDYDDFKIYGLDVIKDKFKKYHKKDIDLLKNIYKDFDIKISKLFNNIDFESIKNSFNYYFNKFKKAIFVAIKDNKLIVFLPFSNAKYKNDFFEYLYLDEEDKKNLIEYKKLKNKTNRSVKEEKRLLILKDLTYQRINKFNKATKKKVLYDRSKWVANNCFFRNNFPEYEGEKLIAEYEWLLNNLLKKRKIPDSIFFLNIRDHQYLKDDLTEPYNYIYESENVKIDKKYIFKNYVPLLSIGTKELYSDIPLPTQDDIQRVSNILFSRTCNKSYSNEESKKLELNWDKKQNKAIFMGKATGCGINIDTNMRLKAASISQIYPDYIKAGITDWNYRLKKENKGPIKLISNNEFNFKLTKPISRKEMSEYKYILIIDGHVTAFRLSYELSFNSVPLIVDSDYYIWFSKLLKPYEHFVPIKRDLSDLIEQIKWCRKNDDKCKEIAKNAKFFYNKYLSEEAMYDYMQALFVKLSNRYKSDFY